MNLRRQTVSTLLTVAAFATFVIVFMQPAARTAQPPNPVQLAIYARGWVDGAAPPGVYAATATCSRRHVCTVVLSDGSCARAKITGYAFPGPWHHCRKRPAS